MAALTSETAPTAIVERTVGDGADGEGLEALSRIGDTRRIFIEVSRIGASGVEMIFHADIGNGPCSRKIAGHFARSGCRMSRSTGRSRRPRPTCIVCGNSRSH